MNKKILILEDEEVLGRVYNKYFEKAGYKTVWVKRTHEAEKIIKIFNPDIIYTDWNINGDRRSGLDMLSIFRKKCPNAYIFMISNGLEGEQRELAIKTGADNYFIKINTPPKELISHIKARTKDINT